MQPSAGSEAADAYWRRVLCAAGVAPAGSDGVGTHAVPEAGALNDFESRSDALERLWRYLFVAQHEW